MVVVFAADVPLLVKAHLEFCDFDAVVVALRVALQVPLDRVLDKHLIEHINKLSINNTNDLCTKR